MTRKTNYVDVIIISVIGIITFISLFPILNTLMISLSDKTSAAIGKVSLWPINFTLAAYAKMLEDLRFFTAFRVSVLRVLLGTSLNLLLSIHMAFPLSKSTRVFPHRNKFMWFIVFNMLFSGGMVPNFLLVKGLGLLDTIWALVLPGAVNVFNTIILMNFYKGIPPSLEESAMMDGARPFTILWYIYVPLAKASIATITLFAAVNHWNAFFDGLIYISTPAKVPLQTYIQSLVVVLNPAELQYMTPEEIALRMEVSNLTFNAAKVIVSMVPIIAIYPFLQRYFVTGIIMGAIKE
ncbi:MAG: carbohydrate ABC transporter permease [Oscillospiraceae bacterium]|nr:carbohydrate ABC transporter permease [Oscillospiraceae bacterium]